MQEICALPGVVCKAKAKSCTKYSPVELLLEAFKDLRRAIPWSGVFFAGHPSTLCTCSTTGSMPHLVSSLQLIPATCPH